jgi:hypothetical protein
MTASTRAEAPKTAVPPSVRHACGRLTMKPQTKSATVKRRDKVALQTFRTAEEILFTAGLPLIGRSCMTVATMASGPNNVKINLPSNLEG